MSKWECIVKNGFDDKNNVYAWSIKKYKDHLYIGTLNIKGCQIYRSNTGDFGTWIKVGINGFSKSAINAGIRNMIVYKNLLWVVTGSWDHGAQVWVTNGEKSNNGKILKWKKASENGFGEGEKVPTIRSVSVFQDKLFIGTRSIDCPRIYRYNGSLNFNEIDPTKWEYINEDWKQRPDFDPYLLLAGHLIVFRSSNNKEHLYSGVYIDAIPLVYQFLEDPSIKNFVNIFRLIFLKCEVWRYDGKIWEKVNKKGFGKNNIMALTGGILDDTLYYGTHNLLGGEIWKSKDGINWEQVVKRGFGNPFNTGFWGMQIFNERLIIGTQNPLNGCQIWASTTNNPKTKKDFIKINQDGMSKGKISNLLHIKKQDGIQEIESFKGHLYIGTASWLSYALKRAGSGCEVWRIKKISDKKSDIG